LTPRLLNLKHDAFRTSVNELRRYFESLIDLASDPVASVREATTITLLRVKKQQFEDFGKVFRRLSLQHQLTLDHLLKQQTSLLHRDEKFVRLDLSSLEPDGEQLPRLNTFSSELQTEIPSDRATLLLFFPKREGLYFGLISEQTLLDSLGENERARKLAV